jgi:hemerythrin
MAFMEWESDFSVGIDEIDKQHHHLIDLINLLFDAMKAKKSGEVMERLIKELIDYTQSHFKTEEALFVRFAYPEAAGHVAEHGNFIETVAKFNRDFLDKKIGVSIKILDFLMDWLKNHILVKDRAYGPFLSEKMKHGS